MTRKSIPMKQVHSTHIHSIGHDPSANELHVEYKNGGKFVYKDVDSAKAKMVMGGHSIGSAMHQHIRGQHDHEPF